MVPGENKFLHIQSSIEARNNTNRLLKYWLAKSAIQGHFLDYIYDKYRTKVTFIS